ncbi:MAG TPA: hypothetical protein VJR58_33135 [Vineibacter sp.]|nr:hypothetical protein [Vineibacter sp.]
MDVLYHRPAGASANAPVLFVLHGNGRNAQSYLSAFTRQADRAGVVLLAPHFSHALFPSSRDYNQGDMFNAAGRPQPRESWSFTIIEQAFDAYRARFGSNRSRYMIYGHSAGAQFVHRFLLFMPDARVDRAVAANAGYYMMPDRSQAYPYGPRGTLATDADYKAWFSRPLTILLGDRDIDPQHVDLVRTPEANLQGPYRLARGENFFATAQQEAARIAARFNWTKQIVPGVAHENSRMAQAAAPLLFG